MKAKSILAATIILLMITMTACVNISIGSGDNDNDSKKSKWKKGNVHEVGFEFKTSWIEDMYYGDDGQIGGMFDVVDSDGKIIYTLAAVFEGEENKNAKEIVEDPDMSLEKGVKMKNYKYEKWEQDQFKGYFDSWKTSYTDEAVSKYEDEYGLIIENNRSYGQGVVFDFNGSAYTFNVEWYVDEYRTDALIDFERLLATLTAYTEEDAEDVSEV